MTLALLSLGGNIGDRRQLMDRAVDRIAGVPHVALVARSSYYKTVPDGPDLQSADVHRRPGHTLNERDHRVRGGRSGR